VPVVTIGRFVFSGVEIEGEGPTGVTARRTGADVTHRAFEAAQDHRTCDLARRIVAVARSHAVSSGDL